MGRIVPKLTRGSKWTGCLSMYEERLHGKIIPSFPDYSADEMGNIWTFKYKFPKMLVQMTRDRPYSKCTVLVAEAYLVPCPEGLEIRHLDSNKLNCRPDNLVYGTRSQNQIDSVILGTTHVVILNIEKAKEVYKLANEGNLTQKEIGEMYGICQAQVRSIKNKKSWAFIHE